MIYVTLMLYNTHPVHANNQLLINSNIAAQRGYKIVHIYFLVSRFA